MKSRRVVFAVDLSGLISESPLRNQLQVEVGLQNIFNDIGV